MIKLKNVKKIIYLITCLLIFSCDREHAVQQKSKGSPKLLISIGPVLFRQLEGERDDYTKKYQVLPCEYGCTACIKGVGCSIYKDANEFFTDFFNDKQLKNLKDYHSDVTFQEPFESFMKPLVEELDRRILNKKVNLDDLELFYIDDSNTKKRIFRQNFDLPLYQYTNKQGALHLFYKIV